MMHEQRTFMPAEQVIDRFATLTGTPLVDLRGPAQTKEISRRRQECMWLLRHLTTASLAQIGMLLGGRDATTVDAGLDRVSLRALNEPDYRQALSDLRKAVVVPVSVAAVGIDPMKLAMAIGLLADPLLGDADARQGALIVLGGTRRG